MKRVFIFPIILFLCGCNHTADEWKTMEIGNYVFDVPSDFKLTEYESIDSYAGKIEGDSMGMGFDFGYYSNSLEQTLEEYLDHGNWRTNLPYRFMKEGITYDQTNMPEVDVLQIRPAASTDSALGKGCDYVATCKHDTTEFDYPIYIPEDIKYMNCTIDTVDNQYRKIMWSEDPYKGLTGIYIKDMSSFNEPIHNYTALSMATSELSKEQQKIVLKIIRSVRRKN